METVRKRTKEPAESCTDDYAGEQDDVPRNLFPRRLETNKIAVRKGGEGIRTLE